MAKIFLPFTNSETPLVVLASKIDIRYPDISLYNFVQILNIICVEGVSSVSEEFNKIKPASDTNMLLKLVTLFTHIDKVPERDVKKIDCFFDYAETDIEFQSEFSDGFKELSGKSKRAVLAAIINIGTIDVHTGYGLQQLENYGDNLIGLKLFSDHARHTEVFTCAEQLIAYVAFNALKPVSDKHPWRPTVKAIAATSWVGEPT